MRRWLVRLAAGVVVLLAGACGLPEDDGPHALARKDLSPELLDPNPTSSTTRPESAATTTVVVYLLEEVDGEVRLAQAEREVIQAGTPEARLTSLFEGITEDETDAGLITAIPAATVLRDVTTNSDTGEVVIDVSEDLLSIRGQRLAQAFAQIVWTATEPSAGRFARVRFLVDGASSTVLDGDGAEVEGPVRRADYSNLTPPER